MGIFERFLSLWVGLAMLFGVLLGLGMPRAFQAIAQFEVAHVNIVVAAFIWLMIYPMMVQIDFSSLRDVRNNPKGLLLTIVVNWLIKPFSMAALAMLFFNVVFANWVTPESAQQYIAGMILLGVAPCTAMVFVWSQLTRGDASYTLVQVSVNDIIMIFAFAPLAGFLLGVNDIKVPWLTLLISVTLYVLLPLVMGMLTRSYLNKNNDERIINQFLLSLKPWAIIGLLATVILLFAFQADTIVSQPETIGLIAIPLIIQTYSIFFLAYFAAKWLKLPKNIAAPACLIGTSNFFELAVAVAISLFGLQSGAALATVVGVLVEVPVMLSLVAFINRNKAEIK